MGVCDVPVISTVCNTVGQGAASLVAAPFDYLAQAAGQAAQWMFQGVWGIFDSTTAVDVTSPQYVSVYNILFGVAVFVTLIFFCLQLITGLIRRDPGSLSKAALGMGRAILGSFLVITLTATMLQIVDQLCVGIVQATGTTMDQMGARIGALALGLTAINISAPGVGAVVTIFLAGLAISAAAIVWFSLLIRKALLLVAIVMAPIALSGSAWEATKGWFGKWASFVLALAVSKLVIVVVFLVATAQLDAPINFDLASISQPIAGVVLMFVAAFAPYMAYRFISFMGFDIYHAMGSEQDAKSSMNRPLPMPNKPPTDSAKKVLDGGGSDKAGSSGGGGSAPPVPGGGGGMAPAAGETGAATAGTAGAGAGAAGAGAAAGPIGIAAEAGAKVVGAAATAGPKLGGAVGQAAEQHAAQSAATDTQPPAGATPRNTPSAQASTPAPPAAPTQAPKASPQPSSGPARPMPSKQ
ncbi:conjugal transfer protein TrbL [Arthrobacter russicus]|uniref:Conjugal transfer protein TrbL n=1 Tax=Arthrobacter russicus TaxID=172040 RepID=A0ABU1JET1_9MICC|nr:conjugal transfer protein TrbL [Arthrobacter russicus]MDR6270956.1 hypothetical protein [Arthrobacter russicus]